MSVSSVTAGAVNVGLTVVAPVSVAKNGSLGDNRSSVVPSVCSHW